jgi:Mn2+/Fe2+ NRAMP family transporter
LSCPRGRARLRASHRGACPVAPSGSAPRLICGAFGWERGVSRAWHEAPLFNGLYTALIALAAVFVLVPNMPLIQVILATQTLNGLLLPVVLMFVVRLANDQSIMGPHVNGRLFNALAYGTTMVLTLLIAALLVASALSLGG